MIFPARCEPPLELRNLNRWHYLRGPHTTGPVQWMPHPDGGYWDGGIEGPDMSAERAAEIGCIYLCVIPTAEELVSTMKALADLEACVEVMVHDQQWPERWPEHTAAREILKGQKGRGV